ncbi:MAG: IS66 family transposase, partial [Armatimonadetes bacterium]|nr:IS66 family transposase [Armatimonadota bacterium]
MIKCSMQSAATSAAANTTNMSLNVGELHSLVRAQAETISTQAGQIAALIRQIEWFRRQIFGQKSERFIPAESGQMSLGEVFPVATPETEPRTHIPAHTRRSRVHDTADAGEALPFFDESKVPVRTIVLVHADVEGLSPDQYEVIGEKVTYRIAQRPGTYNVGKYRRPVIKIKTDQRILCLPAPEGVIENSRADVSFAAGLLIDKFAWHLPLYRQHQRLEAAGIRVSRPWLTQIAQQSIGLLEPIYEAQFESIKSSRVKAMDETPIKAGRAGHGKMHTGYFWPVYGEQDEVCFPFHPSRGAAVVTAALGLTQASGSVLLTDGYAAYEQYVKKTGITHAQCWAHARRKLFEAQSANPTAVQALLEQIQKIYEVEEQIREQERSGEAKQLHRLTHSKPIVARLFERIDLDLQQQGLTPMNPYVQALAYVRERRAGLEVFLSDPDVPPDTNHLERALRSIPLGRRNWLFCWTELGAKHVGIVQSLISTCKLHGVDPYTYLVDVLQRVSGHPAARVAELTPRP